MRVVEDRDPAMPGRTGDEPWTACQPFEMTLVPSELVGPGYGR